MGYGEDKVFIGDQSSGSHGLLIGRRTAHLVPP